MVGASPGGLIGGSASSNNSKMYIFGGFDGQVQSSLFRLALPVDMCTGMRDKHKCTSAPGCNWCELHYKNHFLNESRVENATACYSVTSALPTACHATPNVTHSLIINGTLCNVAAAEQRDCRTYTSYGSCLGSYPGSSSSSPRCKWCMLCTGGGKCVDSAITCNGTDSCGISQNQRTSLASCPETSCRAPTCSDCLRDSSCMWTPQLKWISDTKQQLSPNGVPYPWMCYKASLISKHVGILIAITSTPSCPEKCTKFIDCSSCLNAKGIKLF